LQCIKEVNLSLLTGHEDQYGHETVRLPHFLYNHLTDGAGVVSHLLPKRFLAHISVSGKADTRALEELEGLGQLKTPIISSGFEHATN
jgi:hypothetical protein